MSMPVSGKPGVNKLFSLETPDLMASLCKSVGTFTNIFILCMYVHPDWLQQGSVGWYMLAWQWWCPAHWRLGQVAAREPLEHTIAGKAPVWPGCYGFPWLSFWLCGPGNILMDSLICSLFWGATVSRIIAFTVQFTIVNIVRIVMQICFCSQLASSVRIFPSDCLN